MAQMGYWAVCEEFFPKGINNKNPAMCLIRVPEFENATVMSESRFEAIDLVRNKLRDNIRFLLTCCVDVPEPMRSDTPPETQFQDKSVVIFISLEELGLSQSSILPMAA